MGHTFRELRKDGLGDDRKKAEVVAKDDEDHLWSTKKLDYTICLHFYKQFFSIMGKIYAQVKTKSTRS